MGKKLKASIKTLALSLVVGALLVTGAIFWLRGSLPQSSGALLLAGLAAPASLARDGNGLLTIRAETERDAYLALGFAHAQDRLWQMDFMRRTATGRLSEIVGPSTLTHDRFMRALDFAGLADANLAALDADAREALEAYSEGVNQFLATRGGPWPPGILLLGYEPEAWQPRDCLLWGRLMALQLSNNWHDELLRARLEARLPAADIEVLWPSYPGDAPVTLAADQGLTDGLPLRELAAALPWSLRPKDASNSWVLAGGLSASGHPLLANDLHLELAAPGFWYLVRMETPALTLAGATAPGVPFLIAGHNGEVAWGFTTTHGDTQDFFVEKLAPDNPEAYLTPEGPRPFETSQETIAIKDQAAEVMTLRRSRHGPIMDDVLGERRPDWASDRVLALSWPALRDDDRTGQALYDMNHAGDAAAFTAALRNFDSPQQNIFYADRAGNISFLAAARVPLRKAGDGRRPVPGWSGAYDWTGFIPFEGLPAGQDPPRGNFVAANNKIVPDDYPYLITADWPRPFRAERIQELLAATPGHRVEDSLAMQLDIRSLSTRLLLPILLGAVAEREDVAEYVTLLAAWDGAMARSAPEPLIYTTWITALNEALLSDELGPDFQAFRRPDAARLANLLAEHPRWCDDRDTPETEDCQAVISTSLTKALDFLGSHFGKVPKKWRWGAAHIAHFDHPLFERVPFIGEWIAYGLETDGGEDTLNRGVARFAGPLDRLFEHVAGAGYRAVYDLGDLDASRFMIATGQSGNPLSPFYGNLAEAWRDGAYLTLDGREGGAATTLTLRPQ